MYNLIHAHLITLNINYGKEEITVNRRRIKKTISDEKKTTSPFYHPNNRFDYLCHIRDDSNLLINGF